MNSTSIPPISLALTTIQRLSEPLTSSSTGSTNSSLHPLFENVTDQQHDYYYEDEDKDDSLTLAMHGLSMFIYAVAFLLGITGNGLVIWITGFKMKKTVNTVWFLNLAIADFIFTLFLPLSIVYLALKVHWIFGNFMCKLNSTVAFLNMFASIFFLMVISIDRCISVVKPVWSQNHRTPSLASLIAIGVWVSAMVACSPYFFIRTTRQDRNVNATHCFNDYGLSDDDEEPDHATILQWKRTYSAVISFRFFIGFVLPFTVIVLCYTIIALRLTRNHLSRSSKPFKIIIAVIACFIICWFPYHVFSFIEYHAYTEGGVSYTFLAIGGPITSSLAFLNSCINPILYVFVGRDFRERFRTSIIAVLENAFTEEATETTNNSVTKSKTTSMVESQIA